MEYYTQAVGGQMEVLSKRKPIEKVIKKTDDDQLRERLRLTRQLLNFAEEELKMPSGGSYESYADLGRDHLVWVVHAAPELSMEPKKWWYPMVGEQAYRGYFREDLARREMREMEGQGYETWVGEVDAYSTLGVFNDPVLNTFVMREEVDYAELIFHELVHQKYYVSGDTAFNEAMAEAVAREGVRRWFRHTGRPELVKRYDERLKKIAQAVKVIGGTSDRLRKIYGSDMCDSQMRLAKARELKRLNRDLRKLRTQWGRGLSSWIDKPVNNARLNSFTTYESGVPYFAKLIEECDGDFDRFWVRVASIKE